VAHSGWGRSLRHLVDAGFVEGSAAIKGLLTVESASRSNQVGILSLDGEPKMVFKHHEINVDDADPFLAEVNAYQWLARHSNTKSLAPRLVSSENRVIVIEALKGFQPFSEALVSSNEQSNELLTALGHRLATLHGARPDCNMLRARYPWVLGVADGMVPDMLAPDPEIGQLVSEIEADSLLRSPMEELREAWRATAPMHGDVKFDNILVRFSVRDSKPHIALIDWELAGLGLPAWDLAGVLEGLIVPALHSFDIETALREARKAACCITNYRLTVKPDIAPDNRSLVIATIVRLVQATIQLHAMRHLEPECAQSSRRVLDAARTLAKQITVGPLESAWIL
jgi:thiamine kinase-like enzyme